MSKSETKRNKKQILIVFSTGIASTLAIELAMLFSHAGCDVKAALIDGAEEWVSECAIKTVCSYSPLSEFNKPRWSFLNNFFDMTLVVSPPTLACQQLKTGLTSNYIIEFILKKSRSIKVLLSPNSAEKLFESSLPSLSADILPEEPTMLSNFYQKIFSSCLFSMAARKKIGKKSFYLSFSAPTEFKSLIAGELQRLEPLRRAFFNAGFAQTNFLQEADVAIEAYNGPTLDKEGRLVKFKLNFESGIFDSPNALKIVFIPPDSSFDDCLNCSGTLMAKNGQTELSFLDFKRVVHVIPNLTGKDAFAKLCSYVVAELNKTNSEA